MGKGAKALKPLSGLFRKKEGEAEKPVLSNSLSQEFNAQESLHRRLSPSEHLRIIVTNRLALRYFYEYLARRMGTESLSFWVAVEFYRMQVEANEWSANSYAREIHVTYLRRGAMRKVNLDVDESQIDVSHPNVDLFDDLQDQAWMLLVNEYYRGYIQSPEYESYMCTSIL